MKILSYENDNGSIFAQVLVEAEEASACVYPQQAVERSIKKLIAEKGIGAVMYTRVTEMDSEENGGLVFRFETAKVPAVKLGEYKGLKINAGFDSNIEQLAVSAAAANIEISLPELVIDRKLDSMILEKKAEILESSSVNALTDMHAILTSLRDSNSLSGSDEDIWSLAEDAAVRYTESGSMDITAFIISLMMVSGAGRDIIDDLVNERISERQCMDPELLATETFDAYLRVNRQTEEGWRLENRKDAEELCRIDFLLNAVAEAEDFKINDEELEAALAALSAQYQMPRDQIKSIVSRDVLEYQIKLGKARTLITESAVQV